MTTHEPINDADEDEFMPRERGLLMGKEWARVAREARMVYRDQQGRDVDPVHAAAQEPPAVAEQVKEWLMDECGLRERLDASEDPDAESAFWGGFVTGVRAYLVETRVGGDN